MGVLTMETILGVLLSNKVRRDSTVFPPLLRLIATDSIPEPCRALFEKRTFAHFATSSSDGALHVTPGQVDYDTQGVGVRGAD